jgi:hypothetical protein
MAQFLSLKQLRDHVWPLIAARNLATDMTGISLPIPLFQNNDAVHPYQVLFLIYYAVPDETDVRLPHQITRPYALALLDLQSGELVNTQVIRSEKESNPLIGPGSRKEVIDLSNNERRMLQELFFSRCDEAAQVYAGREVSSDKADHLSDLISLYESLSEPPLGEDYEKYGQAFFSWLRTNAKKTASE